MTSPTPGTPPSQIREAYDVILIGGGLAGSSTALQIKRRRPDAQILVVEQQQELNPRVGEATVELSSLFLQRVLGLTSHLATDHLPKHGLRFWFSDGRNRPLEDMVEFGPRVAPEIPSFQLDRPTLDRHVLATAHAEGVDVLQPAKIQEVATAWPESTVAVGLGNDAVRTLKARWVIDASGKTAFLGRRRGLLERTERHRVGAAWARWTGVKSLDSTEILGRDVYNPRLPPTKASRSLATNHFCGFGYWCWLIPLADGRNSIGLVWDRDLFESPFEGTPRERYEAFVRQHDGLRELLAEAEIDGEDFMSYRHLSYRCRQYMGRGWAVVGDAAAFMDPYYSPGLDHLAISTFATADLVSEDLAGALPEPPLERAIDEHNRLFELSYQRWLDALYLGKYAILGDAQLTTAAMLIDTGAYYLFVLPWVYGDVGALKQPVFAQPAWQVRVAYEFHAFLGRRLRRIALRRRERGNYGMHNVGWKPKGPVFSLGRDARGSFLRGLRMWLEAEISELRPLPRRPQPIARPPAVSEARTGVDPASATT